MEGKPRKRAITRQEAENKKKIWEGILPYQTLIICRGRIELFRGGNAMLRSKTGQLRIQWYERICPPSVKDNDFVCLIGRFATQNQGTLFSIRQAVLLKKNYRKSLSHLMRKYVAAPKEYLDFPLEYQRVLDAKS